MKSPFSELAFTTRGVRTATACLGAMVLSAAALSAQVTSNLVAPSARVTVTLPDGSLLHGATDQVLVFLASGADQASVRATIAANGGQVIGESTTLRMLQVQVADVTRVGALMIRVKSMTGVQHVGVNLFLQDLAGACDAGAPAYVPADHVPPSPASAGDVLMIVVDDFARPNSVPTAALAEHGDIVAAVAVDAGGRNAAGAPIFEIGRNLIELQDAADLDDTGDLIAQEVARHPGKKIVINYSGGPEQCNARHVPALDGRNEADRAAARADCAAADREFYSAFNNGVMPRLRELTNGNVVWVNAAANMDISLENASSISGCDFIPVGGMDGSRLAAFTEVSAAIPVYQQACHVAPRSLPGAMDDGNSFAAPFVAGQFAANWAAHPSMNGCTLGNTVTSLPPIAAGESGAVFDPTLIAAITVAPPPGIPNVPLPVGTLTCTAVTVAPSSITGTVGQTVRLSATAAAGGSNFEFQTSNPEVASVDRVTGAVTIRRAGVATISARRPGSTCSGEANVVSPAETYRGTFTMQLTMTMDNSGWSPNPLTIQSSTPGAPMQLAVGPSLTTLGAFTAAMTMGPGTITTSIPSTTCTSCETPITIPGTTQSDALPTSAGNLAGFSDQHLIEIPMPGMPAMTGTVSVLGPTVQVTLNWVYTTVIAGARVQMTLNGNLTRQ